MYNTYVASDLLYMQCFQLHVRALQKEINWLDTHVQLDIHVCVQPDTRMHS